MSQTKAQLLDGKGISLFQSPIRISGSTSGYSQIDAPAVAGDQTFTLPGTGGTLDRLNRAGNVLQVVEANYATASSTISNITLDSTIPQNTEGAEILSASITPTSSANKLHIFVSLPFLDANGATVITAALFQDSTANAIALGVATPTTSGFPQNINFLHYMAAGTTSSTTFKVRYGASTGTAFINRAHGGSTLGGTSAARITITEIAA